MGKINVWCMISWIRVPQNCYQETEERTSLNKKSDLIGESKVHESRIKQNVLVKFALLWQTFTFKITMVNSLVNTLTSGLSSVIDKIIIILRILFPWYHL